MLIANSAGQRLLFLGEAVVLQRGVYAVREREQIAERRGKQLYLGCRVISELIAPILCRRRLRQDMLNRQLIFWNIGKLCGVYFRFAVGSGKFRFILIQKIPQITPAVKSFARFKASVRAGLEVFQRGWHVLRHRGVQVYGNVRYRSSAV